eukprot:768705-Hanusia_phi.AAC.2
MQSTNRASSASASAPSASSAASAPSASSADSLAPSNRSDSSEHSAEKPESTAVPFGIDSQVFSRFSAYNKKRLTRLAGAIAYIEREQQAVGGSIDGIELPCRARALRMRSLADRIISSIQEQISQENLASCVHQWLPCQLKVIQLQCGTVTWQRICCVLTVTDSAPGLGKPLRSPSPLDLHDDPAWGPGPDRTISTASAWTLRGSAGSDQLSAAN